MCTAIQCQSNPAIHPKSHNYIKCWIQSRAILRLSKNSISTRFDNFDKKTINTFLKRFPDKKRNNNIHQQIVYVVVLSRSAPRIIIVDVMKFHLQVTSLCAVSSPNIGHSCLIYLLRDKHSLILFSRSACASGLHARMDKSSLIGCWLVGQLLAIPTKDWTGR